MTELFYGEVVRDSREKGFLPEYPLPLHKDLSAEDILKWLEEASQFTRMFLSRKELLRWEQVKNLPSKASSS